MSIAFGLVRMSRTPLPFLVILLFDCGQSGTESGTPDAGGEGSLGIINDDSGQDAGKNQGDAEADANGGGSSGAFACSPDGGTCVQGQVCVDNVFINGLPSPPDAAVGNRESDTYTCVPNPCDGSTSDLCACGICQGAQCSAAGSKATCTEESVCAWADTSIATDDGERPIASIQPGDLVYSADHGALRLVPVLEVSRRAVFHHHVIELRLDNGSTLRMSAGHPLADGRLLRNLQAGDILEGATVVARSEIPYDEPFTYDIFPASDSRAYVAAGVLVGTTLHREAN
jgi:hypothetical protein